MEYIIAIPSFSRAKQCNAKTLKMLHRYGISPERIHVFVVEEQFDEYKTALNPEWYSKLIVGKKGLIPQLYFIESYFPVGTHIIRIDDDVSGVNLNLTHYTTLHEFFIDAFATCVSNHSYIWGVYPCCMPLTQQRMKPVSTDLKFIIGCMYGIINRHDLSLPIAERHPSPMDDVELTIARFLKDGIITRFNRVGIRTKYLGEEGGLGNLEERRESINSCAHALHEAYPDITKICTHKGSGTQNIKLISPPCSDDAAPRQLDRINPELYSRVLEALQQREIPSGGPKSGRAKTFGIHRSVALGLVKDRISRQYGLSKPSQNEFAFLWKIIQELGQAIVPFEWTSVYINKNVVCPEHTDSKNIDESVIVSFGDYEGGELVIRDYGKFDIHRPLVFRGCIPHWNLPIKSGTKFSVVFFKIEQN